MRYDYYMGMKNSISEDFKLLTARNIIDILDGDTKFGAFTFENGKYFVIAMPYLSGSMLCDISTQFGLVVRYYFDTTNDKKQNKSRWTYLTDLFEYSITNDNFYFQKIHNANPSKLFDVFESIFNTIGKEHYDRMMVINKL